MYRKGYAATGTTRKMAADNELSKWGFTAVCGEEGQGCYHCSGTEERYASQGEMPFCTRF